MVTSFGQVVGSRGLMSTFIQAMAPRHPVDAWIPGGWWFAKKKAPGKNPTCLSLSTKLWSNQSLRRHINHMYPKLSDLRLDDNGKMRYCFFEGAMLSWKPTMFGPIFCPVP